MGNSAHVGHKTGAEFRSTILTFSNSSINSVISEKTIKLDVEQSILTVDRGIVSGFLNMMCYWILLLPVWNKPSDCSPRN